MMKIHVLLSVACVVSLMACSNDDSTKNQYNNAASSAPATDARQIQESAHSASSISDSQGDPGIGRNPEGGGGEVHEPNFQDR